MKALMAVLAVCISAAVGGCYDFEAAKQAEHNAYIVRRQQRDEQARINEQEAQERHAKLGICISAAIRAGLTADEWIRGMGQPQERHITATVHGQSEQWVYYGLGYIYVENGMVVAWQSAD